MKPRIRPLTVALVVAIVIVLALILLVAWAPWSRQRTAAEILDGVPSTPVTEALLALPDSAGSTPKYQRSEFGDAWSDVDRNGCDTRNDILQRDLENLTFKAGTWDCVVASGILRDPYTDQIIDFERGQKTSELVQIDHVVALADAWKSGAWQWSGEQRLEFANDPLNLLAVDGPTNQDKAASSADQWLPPNRAFHCEYAARQIAVKHHWGLGVTDGERSSLAKVIAGCTPQDIPRSE